MRRLLASVLGVLAATFCITPANATCSETWVEVGVDYFPGPLALPRSQGVTSDGKSWFFSWQGGLEKTNDAYVTTAIVPIAIPPDLILQGSNHIGDIDYANGKIYAPVEDGGYGLPTETDATVYQHPYIALFDPNTLLYTGVRFALPVELQTAGVPWVAVNRRAHELYTSEWNMPHDRINVYDLHGHFRRFINLDYSEFPELHLSRIQGAKVFDGALYASRDDPAKSVYRIDIRTGLVEKLFSLNAVGEMEGIAIRRTPDGATMHVEFIHDNDDYTKIKSSLHHFKRITRCG